MVRILIVHCRINLNPKILIALWFYECVLVNFLLLCECFSGEVNVLSVIWWKFFSYVVEWFRIRGWVGCKIGTGIILVSWLFWDQKIVCFLIEKLDF
jgi:hypothetical protein